MKRLNEQRPAPKPVRFLDDRIAYVICAEMNRGDCQCQWGEKRACVRMEIVARNVLATIDAHPGSPRRADAATGGVF